MGIKHLFQLYDMTAGAIAGPIVSDHRAAPAIRAFHEVLANKNTDPGKYPDDFVLMHLGEQDEETGMIRPCEPEPVATGSDWKRIQDRVDPARSGAATPLNPFGNDIDGVVGRAHLQRAADNLPNSR